MKHSKKKKPNYQLLQAVFVFFCFPLILIFENKMRNKSNEESSNE